MIKRVLVSLAGAALVVLAQASSADADPTDRLRQIISPRIDGNVLYIEGVIDSHIYDYLSFEAKALESVDVIDLNSFGGSTDWGLEIARKIKTLGKTTRLRSGNYCASACVYLYAAGQVREAAEDTWLGIHGARFGAGYTTRFAGLCFVDLEDGSVFEPRKKGCQEFLEEWYGIALEKTNQAFQQMESNGVSPDLRQTYFAIPDDVDWPKYNNVLRKPDWPLTAPKAVAYNLVTKIIPATKP